MAVPGWAHVWQVQLVGRVTLRHSTAELFAEGSKPLHMHLWLDPIISGSVPGVHFRLSGCLTIICSLPALLPLTDAQDCADTSPSSLRRSHGVSESKKLDVCDLKHISPLPQADSLVNRWGL